MKKIALLLMLICSLLMTGCIFSDSKNNPEPKPPVVDVKKTQSFIIYRASADGEGKLLPEKFTIDDNGKPIEFNALDTLCRTKPQDAKMDDVIPIGTKVLSLEIKDGIAYANFSKELKKTGTGSYREMMICDAIVNTLTEFKQIKKVQILIEGKKNIVLNRHIDIEEPLKRNTTVL